MQLDIFSPEGRSQTIRKQGLTSIVSFSEAGIIIINLKYSVVCGTQPQKNSFIVVTLPVNCLLSYYWWIC